MVIDTAISVELWLAPARGWYWNVARFSSTYWDPETWDRDRQRTGFGPFPTEQEARRHASDYITQKVAEFVDQMEGEGGPLTPQPPRPVAR